MQQGGSQRRLIAFPYCCTAGPHPGGDWGGSLLLLDGQPLPDTVLETKVNVEKQQER
jgi:hypothetical protein